MRFSAALVPAAFATLFVIPLGRMAQGQSFLTSAVGIAQVQNASNGSGMQGWPSRISAGPIFGFPSAVPSSLSASVVNPGGSAFGNSGHASASADLRTGQLRAQVAGLKTSDGSTVLTSIADAGFGDSFKTRGPTGPFVWSNTQVARFSFDLTGALTSFTPAASAPFPWDVQLYIVPSGTLLGNHQGLQSTAHWFGNQNGGLLTEVMSGSAVSIGHTGTLQTGGVNLWLDFAPGGDFDWFVRLRAIGALDAPGSFDIDLSHTLQVNYTGPQDTYFESASGVFPGAETTVPEPGSLALVGVGVLALFGMANRRKAKAEV